jgi:hypothetical protein
LAGQTLGDRDIRNRRHRSAGAQRHQALLGAPDY